MLLTASPPPSPALAPVPGGEAGGELLPLLPAGDGVDALVDGGVEPDPSLSHVAAHGAPPSGRRRARARRNASRNGTPLHVGGPGWRVATGQVTRTINVTIRPDTLAEGDETFTVTLTNPTGATIADAVGQSQSATAPPDRRGMARLSSSFHECPTFVMAACGWRSL